MRAVTLALSVYLALSGASAAKLGQPRGPHRDLEESPSASGSSLDSGEEEQATDKPLGDDSSLELAGIGPFSAGFDPTAHVVPAAPAPLTCASSFIDCSNGLWVGGSGQTCLAACTLAVGAGACCDDGSGGDACGGFTGLLCPNVAAPSCNGTDACTNANIGKVIGGCNGEKACENAGSDGGSVGEVNNGCLGENACESAAAVNGTITAIINSCGIDKACNRMGNDHGSVGLVSNSCNSGLEVCMEVASERGTIGNIMNSCYGVYGCTSAAMTSGSIVEIVDSCISLTGQHVCDSVALSNGIVGAIRSSCFGDGACRQLASCAALYDDWEQCNPMVGDVIDSCWDQEACKAFSRDGGYAGNILNSCRGEHSCFEALEHSLSHMGDLIDSCHGLRSCDSLADVAGRIFNVIRSCLEREACYYLAEKEGIILGDIIDSCQGERSCFEMASFEGIVGGIVKNSCNSPGACYKVASSKDEEDFSDHRFIAGIVNGCNAEKACRFAGASHSVIGMNDDCLAANFKIEDCCNTPRSCLNVAAPPSSCTAPACGSDGPVVPPLPGGWGKSAKATTSKSSKSGQWMGWASTSTKSAKSEQWVGWWDPTSTGTAKSSKSDGWWDGTGTSAKSSKSGDSALAHLLLELLTGVEAASAALEAAVSSMASADEND